MQTTTVTTRSSDRFGRTCAYVITEHGVLGHLLERRGTPLGYHSTPEAARYVARVDHAARESVTVDMVEIDE